MKFFRRTDLILIVLILVISAAGGLIYKNVFSGRAVKAEIYYDSQLVQTLEITKGTERTFSIPQKPNVVFYLDGEGDIQFKSSDCPDKVCVHAGKLHLVGQSAACLPNGIVLKIVPAAKRSSDDLDIAN